MNNRIPLFDVMKGVAIFLVVTGHVMLLSMQTGNDFGPARVISWIHMPMFFFISGWFCYRAASGQFANPNLRRRALQLLLPTAVVASLYYLYLPYSPAPTPPDMSYTGMWLSDSKYGYWFCPTLFVIFLMYAAVRPLLVKVGSGMFGSAICLFAMAAMLLASIILPSLLSSAFELKEAALYFAPFIAGLFAHSHKDRFDLLINKKYNLAAVLLATIGCCYLMWQHKFMTAVRPAEHILVAILAYRIFAPLCLGKVHGSVMRVTIFLGRNSLGIYLLHYFFLFPLSCFAPYASAPMNWFPLTIFAMLCAAGVTAVTCGVIAILKKSPFFSQIFTGTK